MQTGQVSPYALKPVKRREDLRRGDIATFRGTVFGNEFGGPIWRRSDGSLMIGPYTIRTPDKRWSEDWEFVSGTDGYEESTHRHGDLIHEITQIRVGDHATFTDLFCRHVFWGDVFTDRGGNLCLGQSVLHRANEGWITSWRFLIGVSPS